MDTVLHNLRFRYLVAPEAQTSLWWIEGDGIVRGLLGSRWAYGIAQDCGPEVGDTLGINTVKTDIAEARCRHRVPFFIGMVNPSRLARAELTASPTSGVTHADQPRQNCYARARRDRGSSRTPW